jgi:tRNA (cmo5U34)-methyltransferase
VTTTVTDFFNRVCQEYDALIEVAVPRCAEALNMMLYYLPEDFRPQTILELGCGTGNLTRHLASRWSDCEITVVDISAEMLGMTQANIKQAKIYSIESSFESLSLPEQTFDLVASSFAIHHLIDPEKERLIHHIYQWLRPNGFFIWADGFNSGNNRLHQANMALYETLAREKGATETQIREWQQHRETLDHYAQLEDVFGWFRSTGFRSTDVLWRYCQNAVLQGQK